jgi:hypothetical protein
VFRGRDDGLDIVVNGFAGHLRTENDGRFALEIGLRSAPSRLRRLMSVERDRLALSA